jgi:hypothetical protein
VRCYQRDLNELTSAPFMLKHESLPPTTPPEAVISTDSEGSREAGD